MKVRAEVAVWAAGLVMGMSWATTAVAGPFAPPAGQAGSTAIAASSPAFVDWANGYSNLVRGPQDAANPGGAKATAGDPNYAVGPGGSGSAIVSLGDGGQITLSFPRAITDGPGFDFAVFENGFADDFLELGLVEVSSNGIDFVRFAATSLTPTAAQVGSFGALDATNLDGLAGKYRGGFGTPFDLATIAGMSPLVDPSNINFVRIIDVIGSINPALATLDSLGNAINDPYPTAFASGGFDLDAVGVINAVPEPGTWSLLAIGIFVFAWKRNRIAKNS
jgi:hypothetical protein